MGDRSWNCLQEYGSKYGNKTLTDYHNLLMPAFNNSLLLHSSQVYVFISWNHGFVLLSFFKKIKVLSLLILSCTLTTDKVMEESLFLLLSHLQLTFCLHQHQPLQSPWHSSLCSCVPFAVFWRSSAWTGHVLHVCVWVHFSLCHLRNNNPCQSQLSCRHQNGSWLQLQRWCLVWSCTFWLVFPKFLS